MRTAHAERSVESVHARLDRCFDLVLVDMVVTPKAAWATTDEAQHLSP
jgi:hypothetical protein